MKASVMGLSKVVDSQGVPRRTWVASMQTPCAEAHPAARKQYRLYAKRLLCENHRPMNTAVLSPPVAAPAKRPRGRPRKTLDERDEGNRRQQLIRAAAKLFRRKGFDATSTRDIAAAVGMHAGSPFYHFESKSALLYAVMEEGMRSAMERQSRVLDPAA